MKKVFALIATVSLFLLSGCGKAVEGVTPDQYINEGVAYSLSDYQMPDFGTNNVKLSAYDGKVFFTAFEMDDNSERYVRSKIFSSIPGADGVEPYAYADYSGDNLYFAASCPDGKDGFWICRNTDETGRTSAYELLHIGPTGLITTRRSLDDLELSVNCLPHTIRLSSDGCLYLMCGGGVPLLLAIDPTSLGLCYKLDDVTAASQLVITDNGLPAVIQPTSAQEGGIYEGTRIRLINAETKSWGRELKLNGSYNALNGGDYSLYLSNINGDLLGFDIESAALTLIANCVMMGLESWANIVPLGDQRFLVLSTGANEGYLLMEPSVNGTVAITLTLATLNGDALRTFVSAFNQSHTSIKIDMVDYSLLNSDNPGAGADLLTTELISGKVPDIIDTKSLPSELFISKGLLTDLYPFIDGDSGVPRRELWPEILAGTEKGGALYELVPSFTITTVVGRASELKGVDLSNYDEMEGLLKQYNHTSLFGDQLSRDDFLRYYLAWGGVSELVDREAGTCSFASAEFENVLELVSALPVEAESYENWIPHMRSGEQALCFVGAINDPRDLDVLRYYFGDEPGFTCLPALGNDICVAEADISLAITSSCSDKDTAWEFLSFFLSVEKQRELSVFGIPIRIPVYEDIREKEYLARTEPGMQSAFFENDVVLSVEINPMRSVEQMRELIGAVHGILHHDDTVYSIVSEEAAAYFSGDRTAQETAARIQSRVTIYLSEQEG